MVGLPSVAGCVRLFQSLMVTLPPAASIAGARGGGGGAKGPQVQQRHRQARAQHSSRASICTCGIGGQRWGGHRAAAAAAMVAAAPRRRQHRERRRAEGPTVDAQRGAVEADAANPSATGRGDWVAHAKPAAARAKSEVQWCVGRQRVLSGQQGTLKGGGMAAGPCNECCRAGRVCTSLCKGEVWAGRSRSQQSAGVYISGGAGQGRKQWHTKLTLE